eukprot:s8_g20.t1
MGHPSLPLPRRQVNVAIADTVQKVEIMRALGTPASQDQTTRSPSCQSYISGDAYEDVRIHKGGCWPSTPTPHAMYKGCSFGMPSVTTAQVQQLPKPKPCLNANAQEFVPNTSGLVLPQSHAHRGSNKVSKAPTWNYTSQPEEQHEASSNFSETRQAPSAVSMLPPTSEYLPDSEQRGLSADVPSQGSALHGTGQCKPCAWFWKSRGCSNAILCDYCHMCPPGELKERKKAKIAAIRAGIIEPRSVQKA